MLRKGYVEQQIDMLGQMLQRLSDLRRKGEYVTALEESRVGCKKLTGLDIDMVAGLPEQTILTILGGGSGVRDLLEVGKCVTLAALLREQSQIYRLEQREDKAASAERRAATLLMEAMIAEPFLRHREPYRGQTDELVDRLKRAGVFQSAGALHRLFRYYDAIGAFDQAENALYALREKGDALPGLRAEAEAFYLRLLRLPDAVLESGNLPRDEVEEALAELRGEK